MKRRTALKTAAAAVCAPVIALYTGLTKHGLGYTVRNVSPAAKMAPSSPGYAAVMDFNGVKSGIGNRMSWETGQTIRSYLSAGKFMLGGERFVLLRLFGMPGKLDPHDLIRCTPWGYEMATYYKPLNGSHQRDAAVAAFVKLFKELDMSPEEKKSGAALLECIVRYGDKRLLRNLQTSQLPYKEKKHET